MTGLSNPKKRLLLIVEDDPDINAMNRFWCEQALNQVQRDGLQITGDIQQSFNFAQAADIVNSVPVDFISLDLALDRGEEERHWENEGTANSLKPSGMRLLEILKQKTPADSGRLVIIKSGEKSQDYALEALETYGVLKFFQKSKTDDSQYMNAVIAALWYHEAFELAEKLRTRANVENIDDSLARLDKSLAFASTAASQAGISEKAFPVTFSAIRQDIEQRFRHPITKLPAGDWTDSALRTRVAGGSSWDSTSDKQWAVVCVALRGFHNFMSIASSQESPIMLQTADLIKAVCAEIGFAPESYFFGHLGGRHSATEPRFILIFDEKGIDQINQIAENLQQTVAASLSKFVHAYDPRFQQEQYQIKVGVNIWTSKTDTEKFGDLNRILDTLGEKNA